MKLHKYKVWCSDFGHCEDDARVVTAFNYEGAASVWARESDADGDYTIISSGTDFTVHVRREDGDICTFAVRGESEPCYYANYVKPEQDK